MNDGFADHSLLVPPHLQELYEMYMKEMDEKNLDRVVALDKFTIRTLKVHQAGIYLFILRLIFNMKSTFTF